MPQTTTTTVTASGQTGGVCQSSGPYRPSRNPSVVVFIKKGDKFPVDPVDGRATAWTMAAQTSSQS